MIAHPRRTSHGSTLLGASLLIALALVTLTDSRGIAAQTNTDSSAKPPAASQPADDSPEVDLPEGSTIDKKRAHRGQDRPAVCE